MNRSTTVTISPRSLPYRSLAIALGVVSLLALILVATPSPAAAADHVNASTGGTLAGGPLALRGYDPVSYFGSTGPELGNADHAVVHDGAVYRFASAENKARFEKSPTKFAPAFGGFCAFGVAVGSKFDGDPQVYSVVDGRLFLNLNPKIQKKWSEDVAGNISKANANWKEIRDTPMAELK